ncbi:hypothetical protein TBS_22990 [Thermobispora bispora]|uniref:DUF6286 domain-containing protein n=1 Tax=Thermobispora bispora (strain ATCC 19993 / DSM 43833 / CBS 139.67 / JCM 10125 / KCTC 9307 / NBRC 14880 / R51) TaxID=469371 RepID=D6Y785_THEBD|nr:DUF6286 domain-containing protein [Thermobispora bispora]ADG87680.1 hypothetical protein Tbis_0957 [Thermobispora bispora DSM 43833]QSI47591.1 hypothetical protein CYL17_06725 [Thermobispora bispora]
MRGERLVSMVQDIFGGVRAGEGLGRGKPAASGTAVERPAEPRPDDRAGRRAAAALRPVRRLAATAVAAALAVTGSALTFEIAGLLAGSPVADWGLHRAAGAAFGDSAVACAAIFMILAGMGLLALALLPGRPRLVPLARGDERTVIGLTRAGLRRTLAAAAGSVDGVRRARVRILARRIEVGVVVGDRPIGPVLHEVGAAVGGLLSALRVSFTREVVVRLCRRNG